MSSIATSSPSQPRGRTFAIAAAVVVVVAAAVYFLFIHKTEDPDGPVKVKIATSKNAWCTLTIVAHKKDYFREEGLEASVEYVQAAKLAMDALVGGDAQFANVVETNAAFLGFTGSPNVEIVATHADVKDGAIVARRDRGIANPADLKGKKLGILQGTTSQIYAERFLEASGVPLESVEIRNLQPPAIQTSVTNGDIDAGSVWQPFAFNMEKNLGGNAIVFRNPEVYTGLMNLAVQKEWGAKHKKAVEGALRAHVKAEKFVKEHKEEAIALVAGEIGLPPDVLTAIWDQYGYRVYLSPKLQKEVEREAKWVTTADKSFKGRPVPDYAWVVNPTYLEAVDKMRVEK